MTAVATAKADVTVTVADVAAKAVGRAMKPVVARDATVSAASAEDGVAVAATASAAHNASALTRTANPWQPRSIHTRCLWTVKHRARNVPPARSVVNAAAVAVAAIAVQSAPKPEKQIQP